MNDAASIVNTCASGTTTSSSPAAPMASAVSASEVAPNTAFARWSSPAGTTSGSRAPAAGSKKLSPIRTRNIVSARAVTLGWRPAKATDIGMISAPARSRSAETISERRSTRSATTPPSSPKITLGTLSATRITITPPAPPASYASQVKPRKATASPIQETAAAPHSSRKSRSPGQAHPRSQKAVADHQVDREQLEPLQPVGLTAAGDQRRDQRRRAQRGQLQRIEHQRHLVAERDAGEHRHPAREQRDLDAAAVGDAHREIEAVVVRQAHRREVLGDVAHEGYDDDPDELTRHPPGLDGGLDRVHQHLADDAGGDRGQAEQHDRLPPRPALLTRLIRELESGRREREVDVGDVAEQQRCRRPA